MADDSEGSRSATRLDDVILDGKLSIPEVRQGMVSRAVVIDAARASSALAVGVTAPAGYGKSTLLTEWARTEDRKVGWVSLDRLDDDPSVLLVLLAAAYARAFPDQRDLVADVRGLVTSPLGRAAPHLATALRRSTRSFVMLLDDLHELHSPSCHDVLSVVISGVPAGSQLVSASRDEQPHMTRLRATGASRDVRVRDLALDEAGAQQIFATAHVPISPQQATAITARTEGWAAGLYLAAMIARTGEQDAWTVAGDDRYLADYLYRESLSQLDHDTQRFLRRTAVLDRFCAPLCDALLGATDGQRRLLALEASNSFLVPLDRRRAWYRYHPLFREFLLGELVRAEPEDVATLHVRAADWYEANDAPAMALEHLLDTAERDRCARLLSQLVLPTYSDGQISTVQRWLSALGDAAIRDYPPLAVLAGWTAVLGGEALAAHRWAAIADDASFDETPVDGTASFQSSRAMLRAIMCPAGPAQMLADAAFAVDSEPPWSPWRDTALCVAAEAHLLAGNVDEASRLFVETSASGSELGNTDTIIDAEATLSLIAMDRGRWDTAAESVGRALVVIDEHRMHDYAVSVLAFAVAARLALHKSEVAECDRQLTRAMRARPACTYALPIQAVRGRLQLAKVFWVRGDHATARHLMREIDDILLRRPDLGVLVDQVAEFRAVVGSGGHAGVPGGPPLSPAELRLLPYLQTHLTMAEIGQRLFVSRNTVATEVASIYRKLGVSSRTEAVEHATAIGLLGA